jgi:hypothetical protein
MAPKVGKSKSDQEDRIIALIEGDSGSGKSFFVGSLKDALIYDTDLGGGLAYLDERIAKNGSERIELSSYRDILADLRRRIAQGKLPSIIVIDHVTQLHQEAIMRHNPSQDSDFGRGGNKATYEWRQLRELVRTFDCNLFCVAHLKGEWDKEKQVGKIADGAKNIEGDMHIVLRLETVKDGKGRKQYPSQALVMKWRRDPEDSRGAIPDGFPFTVDGFEKLHGANYQRKRDEVSFAKPESIKTLGEVLDFLGPEKKAELSTKWLGAAAVDRFEDMTEDQVQKCITYIREQIGGAK